MRRFRFRLQALLDTAKQRERNVQQELARAEADHRRVWKQLAATVRVREQWEERTRENQCGPLDLPLLQEQLSALEVLRRRVAERQEAAQLAGKTVEQRRARLIEAVRSRRSLERVRERMQEDHRAEGLAREIKISDDLATVRAATARIGGNHNNAIVESK